MARTERRFDPGTWVRRKPLGIGEQKPNNYLELWRAFRENRDIAGYAVATLERAPAPEPAEV